jgi:CHAT domain-containing protein
MQRLYQGDPRESIEFLRWARDEYSDSNRARARPLALLAVVHAYSGEFDVATDYLNQAENEFSGINSWGGVAWGLTLLEFLVAQGRGVVAATRGDLREAEAHLRRALALGKDEFKVRHDIQYSMAELTLAQVIGQQGRLLEAEVRIRDVLGRDPYDEFLDFQSFAIYAVGLVRLAENLYEQGRYADAERVSRASMKTLGSRCADRRNLQLAAARELLVRLLAAQRRWPDLIELVGEMRASFSDAPEMFDNLFGGNLYHALALLRTGQHASARRVLIRALQQTRARFGADHYATAEVRGFTAMLDHEEGAHAAALQGYADALAILLAPTPEVDQQGDTRKARDLRLALVTEGYMALLTDPRARAIVTARGLPVAETVFQLAERVRSPSVQRALAASGARSRLDDPDLSELARREQNARNQIAALLTSLSREMSMLRDRHSAARVQVLQGAIAQLQAARRSLIEEVRRRFPGYDTLVNPRPATLQEVKRTLHADEALVAVYVGDDHTYVWAVQGKGPPAFTRVDRGEAALAGDVATLRAALDPEVAQLGDIPDFDTERAHTLYRRLLAPVEAGWKDARHLIVISNGALGHLPFYVLPTGPAGPGPSQEPLFSRYRGVPWLIRTHAISHVPSARALVSLRADPRRGAGGQAFAGFGDPVFTRAQLARPAAAAAAPAVAARGGAARELAVHRRAVPDVPVNQTASVETLPPLPETATEIRALARAMGADPRNSVYLREQAAEHLLKSMDLRRFRVLAFATHGLVPGDLDGLTQPALALSSPSVVGGDDDGLLTMSEILGLRLDSDWVVLSACNTASGNGEGAEAISGLGSAFFYAGSRALLVSSWPVETTSAMALTTTLFRRQAEAPGQSRAAALRSTMLQLIDGPGRSVSGQTLFSYAHPLFWAAFSIHGEGGGGASGL